MGNLLKGPPPALIVDMSGTEREPYDLSQAQLGQHISLPNRSTNKALTYDDGKAPLANLPWAAVEQLSLVQAYGHKKYKDFNNYRKGMEVTRNLSCALRHIKDYLEGHDVDKESGLNPLAHAMCRVAFVLQNIADSKAIDDRYKS
jgi:hypothetical protein